MKEGLWELPQGKKRLQMPEVCTVTLALKGVKHFIVLIKFLIAIAVFCV